MSAIVIGNKQKSFWTQIVQLFKENILSFVPFTGKRKLYLTFSKRYAFMGKVKNLKTQYVHKNLKLESK